jgi:hypothetical protein
MAKARLREAWNHTATLLTLHANMNRKSGTRPFKRSDFHPFEEYRRDGFKLTKDNLRSARGSFKK